MGNFLDGEIQLSKYLKVKDFTHSAKAVIYNIDNSLPEEHLQDAKNICAVYDTIYDHFNGNVILSSGYRCPELNVKVGGSKTSQHKLAQAIDVEGKGGIRNRDILYWVMRHLKYNQLIWEFGTAVEPAWCHVGFGIKNEYLKIRSNNQRGLMYTDEGDI